MSKRLKLEDVAKRLSRSFALEGISFRLDAGDCLGLVGPSGCGKTTTLRLIAGLEVPDRGAIAIDGVEVSRSGRALPPALRGVAMVFQSLALWPHMTVEKNVYHGLDGKRSRGQRREAVREMLRRLGLEAHGRRYPDKLSGGERQRVALARALVGSPGILLLDEPLANLDRSLRRGIIELLRSIKEDRTIAMIYVSHDREELEWIADQILVMEDGAIAEQGSAGEVLSNPRTAVGRRLLEA